MTPKITPFLWFNKNAEEAMNYYVSVFENARILGIKRYPSEGLEGPMKGFEGQVLTGSFELDGLRFMAIDGGPGVWEFSGATSFVIDCENQDEVDYFWGKLSAVPEAEQCGWCRDKFGITWQVIPRRLDELMSDPDPEKVKRVTHVMLQQKKIIIADLEAA